jgi:signal transduction histidine kinase
MNWRSGGERHLLVRSYLVLAGGVMIMALTLDLLFAQLRAQSHSEPDPMVDATFAMIEERLTRDPAESRSQVLDSLQRQLGLRIDLLDAAALGGPGTTSTPATTAYLDSDNRRGYLRAAPKLGAVLRIGSLPEPQRSWTERLLPALFYLSILAVVGWWLRPILRDVQVLTAASQRFAADYRVPLSTARDTSQLTQLARNLDEMSQRLSQLIQNQKELTAALSHEMRTPLARVRFALAVLGQNAAEGTQQQLQDINADIGQVDALIASLLDYARLDHPDLRMEWQQVEALPWLRQVIVACAAQDRQIELRGPSSPGATLRLEPRLMALALSNLIVNGCRHARQRLIVTTLERGEGGELIVEDDGDGIPADKREEIFKAYARLDNPRNREIRGFGLGLAIVARIASLHGGAVTADASKDLSGARFHIRWPA